MSASKPITSRPSTSANGKIPSPTASKSNGTAIASPATAKSSTLAMSKATARTPLKSSVKPEVKSPPSSKAGSLRSLSTIDTKEQSSRTIDTDIASLVSSDSNDIAPSKAQPKINNTISPQKTSPKVTPTKSPTTASGARRPSFSQSRQTKSDSTTKIAVDSQDDAMTTKYSGDKSPGASAPKLLTMNGSPQKNDKRSQSNIRGKAPQDTSPASTLSKQSSSRPQSASRLKSQAATISPNNSFRSKTPESPKPKISTKGMRAPDVVSLSYEIAEEISILRTNPEEYIRKLQNRYDSFIDDNLYQLTEESCVRTREGKAVVEEAIETLKGMKPLKPVKASPFLEASAMDHASDLIINNIFSDDGSDGSTLSERIERYCTWRGVVGENIAYGINSAVDIILSLVIDDGVPSRGHRKNLLNPEFLQVGAAVGPHPQHNFCCVMDFATRALSADEIAKETISAVRSLSTDIAREINLLRADPAGYAEFLQERFDMYVNETIYRLPNELRFEAKEGRKAVQEAIEVLRNTKPLPPMTVSDVLEQAALGHASDIGKYRLLGHEGSDGSSIQSRIERCAAWTGSIGESIDFGMRNARDIVLNLIIDDNVSSRSDRKNLLQPAFLTVGAAIGPHPLFYCSTVINFATQAMPLAEKLKLTINSVQTFSDSILEEINILRENPASYIPFLEERLKLFEDDYVYASNEIRFRTVEGRKLIVETIFMLKSAPSVLPLEYSHYLEAAALDHVADLATTGSKGQGGGKKLPLSKRIEKYCAWKGNIGAVMEYGSSSAREIVMELLIDDGQPRRANRNHILDPEYHYAGAAIGPHPQFETCCVIDFATRVQSFEEVDAEQVKEIKGLTDEIVDELNLLRSNPREYVENFIALRDAFIDKYVFRMGDGTRVATKEGVDAVLEAITVLEKQHPLPRVTASAFLEAAAIDHVKDLGESGLRGHEGSDGSSVSERIERYCAWRGTVGENIDYGNNNARDIIMSLFIDDGVPDRGHRKNLLNPDFLSVGAAIGPYKEYMHHCCSVMDFAQKILPLEDILQIDMTMTLRNPKDLELVDVKKLLNTVASGYSLYDEFKEHLSAGDEILVEFKASKKNLKLTFIHDKMTRSTTYSWA